MPWITPLLATVAAYGFARRRRSGDRERGDIDLLGGLEYGDDRAGEDDADGRAGRCEGIKELSQHVVPQRLGRYLITGDGRARAGGHDGT